MSETILVEVDTGGFVDVGITRLVEAGSGSTVRGVEVLNMNGVGVLDGVCVRVGEGVTVTVGVKEAVNVGTVTVGNGPIKAFDVSAMAVLVLAASFAASESERGEFADRIA